MPSFMPLRRDTRLALQLSLILWLAILSFVGPSAVITGQVSSAGEYLSLITGLITALLFSVLLYAAFHFASGRRKAAMWTILICGIVAAATAQTAADYGGQFILRVFFPDMVMPQTTPAAVALAFIIYLCLYSCNTALFAVSSLFVRAQEAELGRSAAEAAMLRLQLNPHFMVNSLNAVTGLIMGGQPSLAAAMADKLSQFLRISLQMSSDPMITLADELFAAETYLEVEGIRHGNRLAIQIDCPEALNDMLVPNFILQPLVENAVKHGLASTIGTMTLRISASRDDGRLVLRVENDAAPELSGEAQPSFGIGLENTRRRLQSLFGAAAGLTTKKTSSGYGAIISLPLTNRVK